MTNPIVTFMGWIMNGIYEFLYLLGMRNVGWNIILSTIAMILVFSPFIMTKYLMIKGNRLPLSSHGKDVYKKLKDLKKYMYINKDDEELKNWKNYKIYSLILDLEDGKYIKEEFNHLVNLTMDKSIVKE